ncbi:hypothetical protein EB796_005686 [Bugula neritina]|uniref:Caspase family p20 domain-containing protein n=1 Tax=Bugula neritina TaxID=10212 RepID=A0A7J7KBH9_BUGNE|nr:hypothetical protein EB796_005686 [Bugula neritina]
MNYLSYQHAIILICHYMMSGSGDTTDARSGVRAGSGLPTSSAERYVDLDDSAFEYKMNHKNRGVAVIINNDSFYPETQMSDRTGSSVDRDKLHTALSFVGFKDIIVENNLTARKMVDLMKQGISLFITYHTILHSFFIYVFEYKTV